MIRYLGLLSAGVLVFVIATPDAKYAVASNSPVTRNVVARYLEGAELQAETDGQRREIARALQDMLSMLGHLRGCHSRREVLRDSL